MVPIFRHGLQNTPQKLSKLLADILRVLLQIRVNKMQFA